MKAKLRLSLTLVMTLMVASISLARESYRIPHVGMEQLELTQVKQGKMSDELLLQMKQEEEFREALDVLEEQDEFCDFLGATLLEDTKVEGKFTVTFPVLNKQTLAPGEFGFLVYQQSIEDGVSVFFDQNNATNTNTRQTERETDFFCGRWGGWKLESTFCDNRFICFLHNQKGTFVRFVRTRSCRRSTQVQRIKNFVRCGC